MKLRLVLMALIIALLFAGFSLLHAAGQQSAGDAGAMADTDPPVERVVLEQALVTEAPAGAIEATHIYTNSVSLPIPDASCPSTISSTLTVPDSFPIGQVKVGLWIDHTWRGDLSITLTAPDGTIVGLLNHPDGSANNLNVLLDDSSPNLPDSVSHSAPPPYYPNWWQPNDPLNGLRFGNAQGTWTLAVCDDGSGDTGNLNAWTLFLSDGVVMAPSYQAGANCPGNDVLYDLEVVNTTGLDQSFALGYDSLWPFGGPTETGTIPSMMTGTISVTVVVPWYAGGMESGELAVTASGQGGATAEAEIVTMASLASGYADVANLPAGRGTSDHALVYNSGKLYKIGGRNASTRAWLDIYTLATNTWTGGADMPGARTWIDGVAIGSKIYVAGGWSTYANSGLFIYDTGTNTWTTGAAMPKARFAYAGVALDGTYYVIGGTSGSAYQKTLWAYDPATNTWDTGLPSMSVARRYPLAGVIGGKIYVTGGMSSNITYVNSTEVYDPATNSWTFAAPLPADGWVRAADGVIADRYLLLAGGSSADVTASASGLAYDAVQNEWGWLPKLSHLVYALEGDGDGSGLWFVSGRLYENEVWSYSPYTTQSLACPACDPAHNADFSWQPAGPFVNDPVQFTAAASGSPPIAYAWDFGDGGSGSGNPVVHTYTAPGSYLVTMTASNCGQRVVQHTVLVVTQATLHLNLHKVTWRYVAPRYQVISNIRVHDSGHQPVPGVKVYGQWTLPGGSTVDQTTVTNPKGLGKFQYAGPETGIFQLCVTNMTKDGYVYDPNANEAPACKTIVVGP